MLIDLMAQLVFGETSTVDSREGTEWSFGAVAYPALQQRLDVGESGTYLVQSVIDSGHGSMRSQHICLAAAPATVG